MQCKSYILYMGSKTEKPAEWAARNGSVGKGGFVKVIFEI